MPSFNREAVETLDAYIYDYLMKRQLHVTAPIFYAEAKVSKDIDVSATDAPYGFLFDWFSVFIELYLARKGRPCSEEATSYLKFQQAKASQRQRQEALEKMHLLYGSPARQQQHGCGTSVANGGPRFPVSNDPVMRQNLQTYNTMTSTIYEGRFKPPLQANALYDVTMKQKEAHNVGQLSSMDYASLSAGEAAAVTGGHASGQTWLSAPSILQGNLQRVQNQNQQFPGSTQGLAQLRTDLLQKQNMMQSPQFLEQFSWDQLLVEAQDILVNPSVGDFESEMLRVLNNQNMGPRKDGQSSLASDSIPTIAAPAQISSHILPHPESNIFLKHEKSNQKLQQNSLLGYQSDSLPQLVESLTAVDGSVSSPQKGSGQASKSQIERKRKRKPTSSPIPSAQPPRPTLQQNVPYSKSKSTLHTEDVSSPTSTQSQLADMEHLLGDGSLDDNVAPLSSPADANADHKGRFGKGFTFKEMKHIKASSSVVDCCHFSSDGKLFVTGGHDKKASLWCTESFDLKSTLKGHTKWITDVRFSPSMLRVATSSADKTVRVWDTDNPDQSLRALTGHTTTVMSLDFHPTKENLICSCDSKQIRYWNIEDGSCTLVFMGGATQMRFQPGLGSLLAVAADNLISIYDVETSSCRFKLQGHNGLVHSVAWSPSGNFVASVSDDLVRLWAVGSGKNGEVVYELNACGANRKFKTCAFHPFDPVVVVGDHETLEVWNFEQNRTSALPAHDKPVSALVVSDVTGKMASVSHDGSFKFWKCY